MVEEEEDIIEATIESTLESFIEPIIPEAGGLEAEVPEVGVLEAGVLETEVYEVGVLEAGVLEAEARVQAQYTNLRGLCITEGGKRAQSMNTTEEQALYITLVLAHTLRDGHQGIARRRFTGQRFALRHFTLLQGVLL
jgi:hypothetical protein